MNQKANTSLRPQKLADFAGQPELTRDLGVVLKAAKGRDQLPDHLLFSGPPGLGKTTLSQIIAHELELPLIVTSGPAITKAGDIAALLSGLTRPTVLFIDEIHRLDPKAEEMLYSAMEDGRIDIMIGEGKTAMAVPLHLQPFVLVAATTQSGLLSAPLRDRFGFVGRLKLYSDEDLAGIVLRSAKLMELDVDEDGALTISSRSRGTPRVANKWLRRVRDWAQVHEHAHVDEKVATDALESFGVDALGLDALGREILLALINQFKGGPVGVNTLAAAVDEAPGTIEGVYEPYLMRKGLIARTPRGRVATVGAYEHLNLQAPSGISITPPDQLPLNII